MTEEVDKIAQALCNEDERDGAAPWDWYDEKGKERYRASARAVLEAISEPTEAMVEAGMLAPNYLEDQSSRRGCRNIYQAMIAAALGKR